MAKSTLLDARLGNMQRKNLGSKVINHILWPEGIITIESPLNKPLYHPSLHLYGDWTPDERIQLIGFGRFVQWVDYHDPVYDRKIPTDVKKFVDELPPETYGKYWQMLKDAERLDLGFCGRLDKEYIAVRMLNRWILIK